LDQAKQAFIDDIIDKLQTNFSYESLKKYALNEDPIFGECLLDKQIIIDISRLAKSDIIKAMKEFNEYSTTPKAYISKKYGSPEKIDEAIDLLKFWAYNHEFKLE
jgi:hypothetical protein